jgi:hypothetical protein
MCSTAVGLKVSQGWHTVGWAHTCRARYPEFGKCFLAQNEHNFIFTAEPNMTATLTDADSDEFHKNQYFKYTFQWE